MVSLAIKCAIALITVILISVLSRSKNFYIAGLIPLFPSFAIIAHYIVNSERGADALRVTALFGLFSLIPYAVYLFCVYWLSIRTSLIVTLSIATFAWTVTAAILLVIWQYFS